MDIRRIAKRALSYIKLGMVIGVLPFAFLSYASTIYYLAVVDISLFYQVFPSFKEFLVVSAVSLGIYFGVLGYFYTKRSWLFKTDQEILTEANPYSTEKIAPVAVPFWEAQVELMEQHGIDCTKIKEVLEKSKRAQEANLR